MLIFVMNKVNDADNEGQFEKQGKETDVEKVHTEESHLDIRIRENLRSTKGTKRLSNRKI
jgi:hypothetical protein